MKLVKLTQGQFAKVDDDDFERVSNYKWCADFRRKLGKYYAIRGHRVNKKHITTRLHRFIMNPPKGMVVDHINGDTLDNRKSNLRVCTVQQNIFNSKISKNNKTGMKGVRFVERIGRKSKYVAYICNSKRKPVMRYLGFFDNFEDAKKAYLQEAKKIHGEFGNYTK